MSDDHVARILKMLEEGKISAAEAQALLAAVKVENKESRSETGGSQAAEPKESRTTASGSKTFDFRWGHRRSFPVDFAALGKQISAAVSRIDPERIVKEARIGDKLRDFARMWQDDDHGRPVNPMGLPTARRTETTPLDIAPDGALQIENRYGDIVIVGGSDAPSMEVVREAWASSQVEAEIRLGELGIEVSPMDSDEKDTDPDAAQGPPRSMSIQVSTPTEWRDGIVSVTLRLPAGIHVTALTSFGDVRVTGTSGGVEARSTSGSISLDRLGGEIRCEAVSGDIRASGLTGRLIAITKSGDIEAERLAVGARVTTVSGEIRVSLIDSGEVEARSVSGDIVAEHVGAQGPAQARVETVSGDAKLSDINGSLHIATVSGDVVGDRLSVSDLDARAVSGDLRLDLSGVFAGTAKAETVSGDVSIATREGSSFRFDLTSRSGEAVCEHPSPDVVRTETGLAGTIGSGEGSIVVHSLSGDIQITRPA